MDKTVVIDASEVSMLIKDHLGEDTWPHHPEEIVFAKKLILEGELEWIEELLEPLTNRPGHSEILSAIYRQQYVELISQHGEYSAVNVDKLRAKALKVDKTLCNSLALLLPLKGDDLKSSRHALFHIVAGHMYKYMYPSLQWKAPTCSNRPSRLVELLARGLILEQLEMAPCTKDKEITTPTISHKWLQGIFVNGVDPGHVPPSTLKVEIINSTEPAQQWQHSILLPPTNEVNSMLLSKSVPSKILSAKPLEDQPSTPPPVKAIRSTETPHTSTPKNPVGTDKRKFLVDDLFTPISNVKMSSKTRPTAFLLSTITDKQAIRSVAFSSDDQVLAVGPNSKTLRIFDTGIVPETSKRPSLKEVYSHSNYHIGSIYCLAWNTHSDLLASGSNDRTVNLLHMRDGCYDLCGAIRNPNGAVREVAFINDDSLLGVGGGGLQIMSPQRLTVTYQSQSQDHTYCVCTIDNNVVATGDGKGRVSIWDTRQRSPVYVQEPLSDYNTVTSIDYNRNRLSFCTNTGQCHTLLYNRLGDKSTARQWTPHGYHECRSLRYSPDGEWVLTGSYNGSVSLTDTCTFKHAQICSHDDKVIQARWCHSLVQPIIVTTSADKKACLWKLTNLHN